MERVLDFKIHGMDCADEVQILKRELKTLVPDEARLAFDVLRGKLRINTEGLDLDPAQVERAVAAAGMRAEVWQDVQPDAADRSFWQRRGRTALTAISGMATATGVAVHIVTSGAAAVLSGEVPGAVAGNRECLATTSRRIDSRVNSGQRPDPSGDHDHPVPPWDWGVVAFAILAVSLFALLTMEWWLPHSGAH